jgi:phosphate uptake regulator
MEIRRLQEMGGATLLVSIPKDWAVESSLKKGSVVSIERAVDGGLMLYPVRNSGMDGRTEKEIDIHYPSKFAGAGIPNELTAAYLLGYDLIKIKGEHRISSEDRARIVSATKMLIGLEVVEEDAVSITCQFLVDNTAVEPSKIFRRISSIVRAMISDTIKQVISSDSTSRFESVAQRDDEVDRLHFLLVRLIRTAIREPRAAGKFGLSSLDCLDYRVAANSLETAGDYAVELSNSVTNLASMSKSNQNLVIELNDLLDTIMENSVRSFSQKDFKLAVKVFDDYKRLEEVLTQIRSDKSAGVADMFRFVDNVERIARCQRDIADLVSPMSPA